MTPERLAEIKRQFREEGNKDYRNIEALFSHIEEQKQLIDKLENWIYILATAPPAAAEKFVSLGILLDDETGKPYTVENMMAMIRDFKGEDHGWERHDK